MDDNGAVTDEATQTGQGGCVQVEVLLGETGAVDGAILAAEVTDLAGLRLAGITWRVLTALVRVEMGEGASAVAVGRNRLVVDVVHWVLVLVKVHKEMIGCVSEVVTSSKLACEKEQTHRKDRQTWGDR